MKNKKIESLLRPSNAHRWLNCPGSIWLEYENGAPKRDDENYTKEGSQAHALCELLLNAGETSWGKSLARTKSKAPGTPKEMLAHAQKYVEYVKKLDLAELKIEESLQFPHPFLHNGTADCSGIEKNNAKVLHIIDLKYGAGHSVSPENNPQLIFYGAGSVLNKKEDIETVCLHIFQPRDPRGEVEKSVEMKKTDVMKLFNSYVVSAIQLVAGQNKSLVIGPQCSFCPVIEICPKQKENLDLIVETIDVLPTPEALTDEILVNAVRYGPALKTWITKVEKHILARLQAGERINGLYLKEGRGMRKWVENVQDITDVLELYLSRDDIFETKLKTITEIEKKLGGGKGAKEILAGLVRKTVPAKKPAFGADPNIEKLIEI